MNSNLSVCAFRGTRRSFYRSWVLCLAMALALLSIVPLMYGQTTSTIQGTVTDEQGAAITGAQVTIANPALGISRQVVTDSVGFYRVAGLPPGEYTVTIGKTGFSSQKSSNLEVTVNRTVVINLTLRVATVASETTVQATAPLLETTTSASDSTITPTQIQSMPINGRDYLDLLQLVPGVAINRQNATVRSANQYDASNDQTTPIMGERGGNASFLIDGMPNTDEVTGGAASQFNEDSILEFQVITAGYKAEFGHGSGGVINVISKSGTNEWHGGASIFHRNYKLDSSDNAKSGAPFLLRWDPTVLLGGPIVKDKIFFFGSAERIRESRELNFQFPTGTPDFLIAQEEPFNKHSQTYDLRLRGKLDEQFGRHRLTEQVNWTNTQITDYLPLSSGNSLPSTRSNIDSRHLVLGFNDTTTLGDQSNPFLLNAYYQYRGEPSRTQAAHPSGGIASNLTNLFSSYDTGLLFGDLPQVTFGYGRTPALIDQKYNSAGLNLAKLYGRHSLKFGWDFQHMVVDGTETSLLFNQLFTTIPDLQQYSANSAGVYLLQSPTPGSAQQAQIRLRNNYDGLFIQDDFKLFKNFTLNAGLRWDYDSRFPGNGNVSPRIGAAWAITPKTVVRGNWGLFYDHFRLGLAQDIPGLGGANLVQETFFSFPRLFYGNPTVLLPYFALVGLGTPCVASNLTDAQIAANPGNPTYECNAGAFGGILGLQPNPAIPYYGIDHLNGVVAAGHAPIPAGAVVNISNVQSLTGLSAQQFADQASAAIGQTPGYLSWDPLGNLTAANVIPSYNLPITVDPNLRVPHTSSYQFGVQQELTSDIAVSADYYHRDMRDLLGTRVTNLAFTDRLDNSRKLVPGTGTALINSYGPWFAGYYDGVVVNVRKRMSHHFGLEGSYTWAHAIDNVTSYTGSGVGTPEDNWVGVPPVVSQAAGTLADGTPCGGTNANGSFTSCVGNYVPPAGKFFNGINYDRGRSNLVLPHTFLVNGILELPWKFEFSSIFRVQSGFPYSLSGITTPDEDGDQFYTGIDHKFPRNHFNAQTFTNMDVRAAKRFDLSERVKLHAYFEMFNLFNADNPAAVQTQENITDSPFGSKLQVLPGREGQVGLKFEF